MCVIIPGRLPYWGVLGGLQAGVQLDDGCWMPRCAQVLYLVVVIVIVCLYTSIHTEVETAAYMLDFLLKYL